MTIGTITLSANVIVSIVCLTLIIVGYIGMKITRSIHRKDPDYQRKLQERAEEYRRKKEEEQELDDYMSAQEFDD